MFLNLWRLNNMKMDKILLILVVVSLFIAGVQAVQLMTVKSSFESGGVTIGSASSTNTVASSPIHSSSAIDIQAEIPDQVGGCF